MKESHSTTNTNSGLVLIRCFSIVGAILILSVAPYSVAFGLRVPIHGGTEIFYYLTSLVVLPFLSTISIVCVFLLAEKNTWRTFRILLGIMSVGICAFALVQWIKFDLLIKDRITVASPWRAISIALAFTVVIYVIAAWCIRTSPQKRLSYLLLLFSSISLAVGGSHAVQFFPFFLERGHDLSSLQHYPAEDMIGASAPSFSLQTLDQRTFHFGGDRHDVILLDFWATWCGPCVAELPYFQKLSDEFRHEPVTFLAVDLDRDTSRVRPFIDSLGYTFITLYGTRQMQEAYRVSPIPTTFIIDKKGMIRKVYVGYYEKAPQAIRRIIRNLLDE